MRQPDAPAPETSTRQPDAPVEVPQAFTPQPTAPAELPTPQQNAPATVTVAPAIPVVPTTLPTTPIPQGIQELEKARRERDVQQLKQNHENDVNLVETRLRGKRKAYVDLKDEVERLEKKKAEMTELVKDIAAEDSYLASLKLDYDKKLAAARM
jgi:hypothetical protein